MNGFLRIAAYIFHPLLIPILGVFFYYYITPRYINPEVKQIKLVAVLIITVLIPLISFFLLRNIGVIKSISLEDVNERKIPLMLQSLLLFLLLKMVFDPYNSPELYYFFLSVLYSTIAAFVLVLFKMKASLHMMAISGLTAYIILLSVHFSINLLIAIGLFFIINGWIASSRLHTRSHTQIELIIGFFLGVIPQFILLSYWL